MRDEVSERPLVLAFLALVGGMGVGFSWLSLVGCLVALVLGKGWWRGGFVMIGLVGFLMRPVVGEMYWERSVGVDGEVKILGMGERKDYGEKVIGELDGKRVVVRFDRMVGAVPGDIYLVNGELKGLPEGSGWQDGATAAVKVESYEVVKKGWGGWKIGVAMRESFGRLVDKALGEKEGAFVKAVCFGDTADLDEGVWRAFGRTGTIHVVSTSGLHAVVAAGFVMWLLRFLPVGREWQLVMTGVLLTLYAGAAGLDPPIVRACLMVMLWGSAYLFKKEGDGLSALGMASVLNLLVNPYALGSIGFWLSVVSVAALVMFVEYGGSKFLAALKGGFVAWLATAPLVGSYFGRFAVVGVLANLLVVPVASMVVVLGLFGWLSSLVWEGLGVGIFRGVVGPLAWVGERCIEGLSELPFSSVMVPWIPVEIAVLMTVCLVLLWRGRRRDA